MQENYQSNKQQKKQKTIANSRSNKKNGIGIFLRSKNQSG